jgi:hypothetical protein
LDEKGRFGGSGPSALMASHWPPKKLPIREVELRAGYTIAWMQRLFDPGTYRRHTPDLCQRAVLSDRAIQVPNDFWHFTGQIHLHVGGGSKKQEILTEALRILEGG